MVANVSRRSASLTTKVREALSLVKESKATKYRLPAPEPELKAGELVRANATWAGLEAGSRYWLVDQLGPRSWAVAEQQTGKVLTVHLAHVYLRRVRI